MDAATVSLAKPKWRHWTRWLRWPWFARPRNVTHSTAKARLRAFLKESIDRDIGMMLYRQSSEDLVKAHNCAAAMPLLPPRHSNDHFRSTAVHHGQSNGESNGGSSGFTVEHFPLSPSLVMDLMACFCREQLVAREFASELLQRQVLLLGPLPNVMRYAASAGAPICIVGGTPPTQPQSDLKPTPTQPQPNPNLIPTPTQPQPNPSPTPTQPNPNPTQPQPHPNPIPTPSQPHPNPIPTLSQPYPNPTPPPAAILPYPFRPTPIFPSTYGTPHFPQHLYYVMLICFQTSTANTAT